MRPNKTFEVTRHSVRVPIHAVSAPAPDLLSSPFPAFQTGEARTPTSFAVEELTTVGNRGGTRFSPGDGGSTGGHHIDRTPPLWRSCQERYSGYTEAPENETAHRCAFDYVPLKYLAAEGKPRIQQTDREQDARTPQRRRPSLPAGESEPTCAKRTLYNNQVSPNPGGNQFFPSQKGAYIKCRDLP